MGICYSIHYLCQGSVLDDVALEDFSSERFQRIHFGQVDRRDRETLVMCRLPQLEEANQGRFNQNLARHVISDLASSVSK